MQLEIHDFNHRSGTFVIPVEVSKLMRILWVKVFVCLFYLFICSTCSTVCTFSFPPAADIYLAHTTEHYCGLAAVAFIQGHDIIN